MNKKFFLIIISAIILTGIAGLFFYTKPGKGSVCLNNYCFQVEIAKSPIELARGMMFRKNLDQNMGMLFIFEKEGNYPFWMKNTLIPLDIIWINSDSKIIFISKNNLPCKEINCPSINPNQNAKYVLEINAGMAKEIDLKIGDSAVIK